jgi:ribosome-binding factor A
MAEVKRAARVAERLREELAGLVSHELGDPRVQGVIVSRVKLSDDLRHARVLFRLLEGGDDAERRKSAQAGLERAAGVLRREVTARAGLRFAPELKFHYDEGQEAGDRIEQLLDEVRRDREGK